MLPPAAEDWVPSCIPGALADTCRPAKRCFGRGRVGWTAEVPVLAGALVPSQEDDGRRGGHQEGLG